MIYVCMNVVCDSLVLNVCVIKPSIVIFMDGHMLNFRRHLGIAYRINLEPLLEILCTGLINVHWLQSTSHLILFTNICDSPISILIFLLLILPLQLLR